MTEKTLSDCQLDAVILHGLAQALEELENLASSESGAKPCPSGNGMTCLIHVLVENLDRLANDLDNLKVERLQ